MKEKTTPTSPKTLWFALSLVVFSFIIFGNSIRNGFSMDDDLVTSTSENYLLEDVEQGISGIPAIFKRRYVSNGNQNYSYRPVTSASFAIERSLYSTDDFDKRASFSHFINVLLYGIIGVMLFFLLLRLLPDINIWLAWITVLIFMVHPIHSEVVNNIKCRDELLVFIFGLSALFQTLKGIKENKTKWYRYLLTFLFIALSALSKKTGLVFMGLIPLTILFHTKTNLRRLIPFFVLGILGGLMLIITAKLLIDQPKSVRQHLFFENPLYADGNFSDKLGTFFYSIGWYCKMMVWPYPLRYYYGYNQVPIAAWGSLYTWIGIMVTALPSILLLTKIKSKPMWGYGYLWFMLSISGIANIWYIAPGIVAERFAFIGSFGLILTATYYFHERLNIATSEAKYKRLVYGTLLLVFIPSLGYNWKRNGDWNSRLSLYKNDIINLEQSAKANSLLGQEYRVYADKNSKNAVVKNAYIDSSIHYLKRATEIYPKYHNALNNLAFCYQFYRQDFNTAKAYFKRAYDAKKEYDQAAFGLADCYQNYTQGTDYILSGLAMHRPDSTCTDLKLLAFDTVSITELGITQHIFFSNLRGFLVSNAQNLANPNNQKTILGTLSKTIDALVKRRGEDEDTWKRFKTSFITQVQSRLVKRDAANVSGLITQIENDCLSSLNNMMYAELNMAGLSEIGHLDFYNAVEERRKTFKDSTIMYFDSVISFNPRSSNYYDRYSKFLNAEGMVNKFIEVNEKGISTDNVDDKSQLYFNLCNIYSYKKDLEKTAYYVGEAEAYVQNKIDHYKKKDNDQSLKMVKKYKGYLKNLSRFKN